MNLVPTHMNTHLVSKAWTWFTPRFKDKSLELRYAAERRARVLPMVKIFSAIYLLLGIVWWLLPRDGMAFDVWLFFRLNSAISTIGCAVVTLFFIRSRTAWRYYDLLILILGCHFVIFQGFTRHSTEMLLGLEVTTPVHDEGLAILTCIAWITGFFCYAEVGIGYFVVLVHIGPLVWILYGVWFGVSTRSGMFVKLSLMYYLISVLVLIHTMRAERARRQMLLMQVSLEGQAKMERALAHAERTATLTKVCAAEQQALHAFMAAVFDIMGQLEWRTLEADSEPTLCFVNDPNPALDALLKTSTSGMPLEVVLGPPPDPRAPGRGNYTKERSRLWSYAQMEATRPREEPGESTGHQSQQVPARKMAITCADSSGRQFEAELLIGPGRSGRALFGILLVNSGQNEFTPRYESKDRYTNVQMEAARACSDGASPASSNNSSEAALLMLATAQEQQGEVAVWVDIWNPKLPILKCTVAFTCLSGPSSSGAYFIDWVEEQDAFYQWAQCRMNLLMSDTVISRDDSAFQLRLRPPGAAGSMLQFQAFCHLEVVPFETSLSMSMDESETNDVMAKLALHNVTHCRRKKNRIGGGRHSTRNRACKESIVSKSPVNYFKFPNSKIWLDVHSTRLRILDYTLSYAGTIGAGSVGLNFLDWVVDEERFQEWLLSHHQAHPDTGIQPQWLNQVVLRDPRKMQNMLVADCIVIKQTKCWPDTPETQALISACVDMHISGRMEGSPKQAWENNDTRPDKEPLTKIHL